MDNTTKKLTLFSLTWPIFIEVFLHMLMGNADTLMLSQYSDNSVAAVGATNQILYVIIVMFGFVATGSAIIIAQKLGAKQDASAAEVAVVALVTNFLFGMALSVILFFMGQKFLVWMDLPTEIIPEAKSYILIVGSLSFIQALFMTAGAIIRSYGYTKDTMYVTIGMNVLNVIGNFMFIFGPFGIPVLGVTGVAISTAASRLIGFIIIMIIMFKRIEHPLPFMRVFNLPIQHVKDLLKIGIPSAGEHLSYNVSQMVIMYFIAMMGTEAITTKVYTQNIMMFIFLFTVAVAQGTQILIGHMVGAKKYEEAYNRCLKSLRLTIVVAILLAFIFSLVSKQLLQIFTTSPDIITVGVTLIWLTILLEPGRAFNLIIINALRAAGDVRFPVYIGVLSMWGVSVTISYVLGVTFGLGLVGVWIALIVDEWLRGIIMYFRWRSRVWQKYSFTKTSEHAS
ncbi:MATE family efflux transporter [Bacillus sp. HMF5848]|uniref:MATE family efflux transporter n=1 Tax=Bacillus sp. HMF5848 TaxID=2495421 RepID=UPI000F774075|nr:MATE family efflux transporter [Bacillus sp. HMF5848]RSK29426.1 MATE family efflux transporter [Bacillus sp. HMF5848]